MFFRREALEDARLVYSMIASGGIPPSDPDIQRRNHEQLVRLSELLDTTGQKKPKYESSRVFLHAWSGIHPLYPEDIQRAQTLYERVAHAGGSGSQLMQKSLLRALILTPDTTTIPFWLKMIDFTCPRDWFRKQRYRMALAALTLLALMHNEPAAYAALRETTHHSDKAIRAEAVRSLFAAYTDAGRSLPPDDQAYLKEIATTAPTFLSRFHARMAINDAGMEVPLDNPDGVYEFRVSFWYDKQKQMYRTIALCSEDTLEDLHLAIQDALGWENDHLYSFYMHGSNGPGSEAYEFASPWAMDAERITTEGVIGELGLVKKHTFLYVFDYGDYHMFRIEVVGIHPQAEPGDYPRVVDSKGKAPTQYPIYDEDGNEIEEEWEDE